MSVELNKCAIELNKAQTATTPDTLQDQLDQMMPVILLGNAPTPAPGKNPDENLALAK